MMNNVHMLPGKIGKSIEVKGMLLGKASGFQLLQKPRHLVTGIFLSTRTNGIISLINQSKLFQFLRQASLGLLACRHQIIRGNGTTLKLIHRIQHIGEKFRTGFHRCIGFQFAVQHSGGCGHCNHATALIETFLQRKMLLLRNTTNKTGKRQHLCIQAGRIASHACQGSFCCMAHKLGNH